MEPSSNHLGRIGDGSTLPNALICYIFQPSGVSREEYITHCHLTNTVSLITDQAEVYHRVPIGDSSLQQLIFPLEKGALGSPVVCVTIPLHNQPFVVSVHRLNDAAPVTNKERSVGRVILGKDTSFNFHADGDEGSFQIVGDAPQSTGTVRLLSDTTESLLDVHVQGEINVEADVHISLLMQKGFEVTIGPEDARKVLQILTDNGLTYNDDYRNQLTLDDNGLNYRFAGKSERAMLGESSINLLDELLGELAKLTVYTAFGPSSIPQNVAKLLELRSKLPSLLSDKFSHA